MVCVKVLLLNIISFLFFRLIVLLNCIFRKFKYDFFYNEYCINYGLFFLSLDKIDKELFSICLIIVFIIL